METTSHRSALLFTLLLASCASAVPSTQELQSENWLASNRGRGVAIVVYQQAEMNVLTPGQATANSAGGLAAAALVDSFTRPDGTRLALPSSSHLLAQRYHDDLEAATGLRVVAINVDHLALPIPDEFTDYAEASRQSSCSRSLFLTIS